MLKICEELRIGFVPWGPLGAGYLTGKMDARTQFDPNSDLRSEFQRFSPEPLAANTPVVDVLKRSAEKKKARPAQIALAVTFGAEAMDCSNPRYTQKGTPDETLGAINVQLTAADLREIESAFSAIRVQDVRLSEKHMQQIDRS